MSYHTCLVQRATSTKERGSEQGPRVTLVLATGARCLPPASYDQRAFEFVDDSEGKPRPVSCLVEIMRVVSEDPDVSLIEVDLLGPVGSMEVPCKGTPCKLWW